MNPAVQAAWQAIQRLLRGPRASRLLQRFGIDPRRYWLLMDLFGTLSERGEMLDQLGRAGVALDFVAWIYFGLSAFLALVLLMAAPPLPAYFLTFQVLSAFLLLSVLLSESANSLVNPVEALVLAHQPINGATYTAAKLSHLLRIVLYLVPGMNVVPAFAALALGGTRWSYPFLHLAAALAVGLVISLFCCAFFGWLIRFLPARRLKAAGQLAGAIPLTCMMWMGNLRRLLAHLHLGRWLPRQPAILWGLAVCGVAVAALAVALGIRSLSADYLLRVSGMLHGGASAGSRARGSRLAALAARFFGGQPARGGFAFVGRMMLRDWQFRRQLVPMLVPILFGFSGLLWKGWRSDPFAGVFSLMHLLPHFAGMLLFMVCNILVFSSDYKGAWIFQLFPEGVFQRFAAGAWALLWIGAVVIPHLLVAPLLAWRWGPWHAGLFTAYSLAAASVYLGLELRLIDGAPFSKQMDPSRGASSMAIMMLGGLAMAIAVGLQYLVFHWQAAVVAVTLGLAGAAYLVTRSSIQIFALAIGHNLGLESGAAGDLYKEVGM